MASAVDAFGAGEGGGGGAGVDYGGLALGGVAYPDVDVVGAVALVEGAELLLGGGAGEVAVGIDVAGAEGGCAIKGGFVVITQ